jgi:CheY-like chemotaxis protein
VTVTVRRLRPQPWERYLVAESVVSVSGAEGTLLTARSFTLVDVPATTVCGTLTEHEQGFLVLVVSHENGVVEDGTTVPDYKLEPPVYVPRLPFLQPGDRVALRVREAREYEQFRLPLALEEVNGAPVSALLGLGQAWDTVPRVRRGPRRTALVINDEAHVQRLLQVNLERAGWEVVVAEDGIVGLERARETRPDVILCDEIMPRQGGFDTIRQLQAEATTSSVPILLFVYPRATPRTPGPLPNVAAYVSVPFNPREVLALAETVAASAGGG